MSSPLDVVKPGGVTFKADVTNTKAFLESTPLRNKNSEEYAFRFLARGLDAAQAISNAFNAQFDAGFKPVTDMNYGQDKGGSYRQYLAPIAPEIRL